MKPAYVTQVTPLEVRMKGETTSTAVQDKPSGMSFTLNDRVLVESVDGWLVVIQKVVSA